MSGIEQNNTSSHIIKNNVIENRTDDEETLKTYVKVDDEVTAKEPVERNVENHKDDAGKQPLQAALPLPPDNTNAAVPYADIPYYEYATPVLQRRPPYPPPIVAPQAPVMMPGVAVPAGPGAQPPPKRSNRKLWYIAISLLLVSVIVFAAGLTVFINRAERSPTPVQTTTPVTQASPTPAFPPTSQAFQQAPCPFAVSATLIEGRDVRCGWLTVPEDHNAAARGKSIQLAVAVFKSAIPDPSATPIVYLDGGPGGATLSGYGPHITVDNRQKVSLGHDIIFFDQRGTGFSKPALDCPELKQGNGDNRSYVAVMQSCHDRLKKTGVNFDVFTTLQDAADVHDLVHALGYRQANLYGVSYGTRLALTVMRLFPADVRSVVLDSTVPLQHNLFTSQAAVTQHAFDTFFKGCMSSNKCHAAYPQVESAFYRLVRQWNDKPVTVRLPTHGNVSVSGDDLTNWLFASLYDAGTIPELPQIIMQLDHGEYTQFARLYEDQQSWWNISYGMYYSVECGEDMAYTNRAALEASVQVMRPELRDGMRASLLGDWRVCQIWQQPAVPAQQKQPVVSTIPTLVLAGEFDPITPPDNGRVAARTLSRSYFFLFPGATHGLYLTGPCPSGITVAFLARPDRQPDAACIASMSEPAFQ
ncbi:MAG: alpha/beta fold hydrolase [Ktedonobacteraceae bacterium]|nr:alpha/beta fold hydrolase [Ktedonobacteraceae bacterium]